MHQMRTNIHKRKVRFSNIALYDPLAIQTREIFIMPANAFNVFNQYEHRSIMLTLVFEAVVLSQDYQLTALNELFSSALD